MNLVSVIVPVYNAEAYIRDCIDSILYQRYENIELILINDGSIDRSGIICEEYATKDSRVKVIHQDNTGPSIARNKGINNSKGEYLQFVDSDDQIDHFMIEKLISAYIEGIDLAICGYKSVIKMEKYVDKEITPVIEGCYSFPEFMTYFPDFYKKWLINSPCNKLYDASIIRENNLVFPIGVNNGEDLLFNIDYFKYCRKVNVIRDPLYHYIKFNNPFSLTKQYKKNYFENRKKIFNNLRTFLMDYIDVSPENGKLAKEIYTDYILKSLANIFHENPEITREMRKKELRKIINDKWIRHNMAEFNTHTLQEKLVKLLLKCKSIGGLSFYFNSKNYFRNNFKRTFHFIKKLAS